jgi:hypothetical protein
LPRSGLDDTRFVIFRRPARLAFASAMQGDEVRVRRPGFSRKAVALTSGTEAGGVGRLAELGAAKSA